MPKFNKSPRGERRLEVIEYIGGRCVGCGDDNLQHLILHHKNGTHRWTDRNWYLKSNWKESLMKESIMLVCYSCHALIHNSVRALLKSSSNPFNPLLFNNKREQELYIRGLPSK